MNNFFTELEPITDLVELQITLKSKGGIMSVIVMPKAAVNDPALGSIKPLQLSGSAAELDAEFATAIKQPLALTAGIVSNVVAYEASNKAAQSQTAAAKAEQDAAKRKREADQREFDKQTGLAEQAIKDKDFAKAITALNLAMEVTDKKDAIIKRIKDVETLSGKGSLFGGATDVEETPAEQVAAEVVTDVKETEDTTGDEEEESTED